MCTVVEDFLLNHPKRFLPHKSTSPWIHSQRISLFQIKSATRSAEFRIVGYTKTFKRYWPRSSMLELIIKIIAKENNEHDVLTGKQKTLQIAIRYTVL